MTEAGDHLARARHPDENTVYCEAIVQAANRLLDRKELHEFSVNAIALEAGPTKPNLYRCFESREEILVAMFLEELRSFAREVVPEFASHARFETAIVRTIACAHPAPIVWRAEHIRQDRPLAAACSLR
jgi:AcrR family transcriptional regulator